MNQADLLSTLMANNDKAREHALKLNEEVGRLRKRETELTNRIQALLALREEKTEQEREFLEWLLMFRLESDEPRRADHENKEQEQASDERACPYVPTQVASKQQLDKFFRLRDELALLSRLKKREKFAWLESRITYTVEEIESWEQSRRVKLPSQLRNMYQYIGANAKVREEADKVHIHAYSPFLSLLPLKDVGWTEVWGGEDEDPGDYLDDDQTEDVLEAFQAGHEFDDSFVCDQLCGKSRSVDDRTRVLLIGAPLDIRMPGGGVVNSRMFLNIRPCEGADESDVRFVGDGLLYRLDCFHNSRDEGDSELIKIGTPFDWTESCFNAEVEDRLNQAGENDPLVKRYPWVVENRKKRLKEATEQDAVVEGPIAKA